jgi:hypothetical protein
LCKLAAPAPILSTKNWHFWNKLFNFGHGQLVTLCPEQQQQQQQSCQKKCYMVTEI